MAIKKPKMCPLVEVTWLDAWGDHTAYTTPANAENEAVTMVDVGFQLKRTKKGISLASSACNVQPERVQDYRHTSFIPSGMIKKVVVLKK